ncbi:MAG: isoleucine--tRNA ligase [Candidatus Omnitrophica bacterium]|nr:isoleucine--tRNA ligase [Candidatus Omnitrophota bacterium]
MSQDYRNTLNLPKTSFNMRANLPKNEPKILDSWQARKIYDKIKLKYSKSKSYILHDGPPYANGHIHIGHVLNKTLKDIVVKYKTMKGYNSPFVPGWDCHGLPVEHQLFKELGINKDQIDQLKFRRKAYDYAVKFVKVQKQEFERLGVFADWDKPYLTLDNDYEESIIDSFAKLVKKGYIYRGLKPVNWCARCETALAEAEVEYEKHTSPSVFIKLKIDESNQILKDSYFVIWTTTPWTLIANVAVAAHPDFNYAYIKTEKGNLILLKELSSQLLAAFGIEKYELIKEIKGRDLEGLGYTHAFEFRKGKVVLADYVSKEEGSGLVHIAPGHGSEDYLTGLKYKLDIVMPVDAKGVFDKTAHEFNGLNVFKANDIIIDKLKMRGSLLRTDNIDHSYPHCWRCKSPVIFRATKQWFLRVDHKENIFAKTLRRRLQDVIKKIRWIPATGRERIATMVQLRPDWCLSRQRYWGVPVPALVCNSCQEEFLEPKVIERFSRFISEDGSDAWLKRDLGDFLPPGLSCPHCAGKDFSKGTDILDVWFDSGVSHQAVLKRRADLTFPCELYLEGSDQHRGWFQSSLIPSMCIDKRAPFKAVLTHGFVVDGNGRKMSKSLGNVISPQEIIKDYGVDILRLWVASSDYNFDVRISVQILARLSEAYRKIRNTIRFLLGNLYDFNPREMKLDLKDFSIFDRWAISRLSELTEQVGKYYEDFDYYKAYQTIYSFCLSSMSTFYLDVMKDLLYTSRANSKARRATQSVLYQILLVLSKLIAPILSFTAEEVWQSIPAVEEESVFLSPWPKLNKKWRDLGLENDFRKILEIRDLVLKALETKRSQGIIGSPLEARVILEVKNEKDFRLLDKFRHDLPAVFIVSQVDLSRGSTLSIKIEKAKGTKCARCWNYNENVGLDKVYPEICPKCIKTLGESGEAARS